MEMVIPEPARLFALLSIPFLRMATTPVENASIVAAKMIIASQVAACVYWL